jgi:hypothetical protein
MNNSQNEMKSSALNAAGNANTGANAATHETKQRLWVREQEVNALKIQNRHLLAKLEEAEKKARPDPITSEQITAEVHKNLQPVITQVERSLQNSFEMISGTLKGIYQQSHRAQEVVEEMTEHVKTVESRMQEQRKADQLYFQEKIFATITTFCDRIERQVEQRLKALSSIEVINVKQNELLTDLEGLKSTLNEMQTQNRNAEEMARDGLRQVQNHRNDLKNFRNEVQVELRSFAQIASELPESLTNQLNAQLNASKRDLQSLVNATAQNETNAPVLPVNTSANLPAGATSSAAGIQTPALEVSTANENHLIAPYAELNEVHDIRSAIAAGEIEASNEDLGLVLELLNSQKEDVKAVAQKTGNFLSRAMNRKRNSSEQNLE